MGNRPWIVYDPGICHQDAGNICPVFINACVNGSSGQGAGDVASPPAHDPHLTVRQRPIEARQHHLRLFPKHGRQIGLALLHIQLAVVAKGYPFCGVHKIIAQIGGHQLSRQVFPPGDQIVDGHVFMHIGPDLGKFPF